MLKGANFLFLIHHPHWFHYTNYKLEQGSYSKLCASLALPIFQLLATVIQLGDAILTMGMHKCTHYWFIFLSRWDRHQMGRPLWQEHVAFLFPCLYFQSPSSCIAFWQLLGWETGNYYYFGLILMQVLYLVGILLMTFDLLRCGHSKEGNNCPSVHK